MQIQSGTKVDGEWIRKQLIAFNRQHVPDVLYERSEALCYTAYDEAGHCVGGITASYRQHGYLEYGRLDDHPALGQTQYFFVKRL